MGRMTGPVFIAPSVANTLGPELFFDRVRGQLNEGGRLVSYYGRAADDGIETCFVLECDPVYFGFGNDLAVRLNGESVIGDHEYVGPLFKLLIPNLKGRACYDHRADGV